MSRRPGWTRLAGFGVLMAVLAGAAVVALGGSSGVATETTGPDRTVDVAAAIAASPFADPAMAEASLQAMADNGALAASQPLDGDDQGVGAAVAIGVVHRVDCAPERCEQIRSWATDNGFIASEPHLRFGHGGTEEYHVELRQVLAAEPEAVSRSAEQVLTGVLELTDGMILDELVYDGWAPELVDGGDR